ncbi:PIN domain-containing protein [Duganella sp. CY15W]|uniref:PIN domain-containing protein n=1 Tax=Duganella sp. CY15W TaxID=2692172 RepID=UPI00136A0853|nr:PIN domain-containing protein [Duganella sp. CY15W]MYM32642.1 PIN domain-containing protein [Duganella sp. CY15W]
MVITDPVIIDTNIFIDLLNGVPDARRVLDTHIDIALAAITYAEVASGCTPAESGMFEAFLAAGKSAGTVQMIHTDDAIIKLAANFNKNPKTGRGYGKKQLADSIIGATAVMSGRTLLTRNAPDFKGAVVKTPYQGQLVDTPQADGTVKKVWVPKVSAPAPVAATTTVLPVTPAPAAPAKLA